MKANSMNPTQVLLVLVCLMFVLGLAFLAEVVLFRIACALCFVRQPGFLKSAVIVLMLLVVPVVADFFLGAALYEAYRAADYPLWEAGIVEFMLALPIHMLICSVIHSWMMGIRISECLSVWFVEKMIKLAILFTILGTIALIILANPGKG